MEKKTLMSKDQVTEKIVSVIKEHFRTGAKFDEDYDEPIFWNTHGVVSDEKLREKLSELLNGIEGFDHVQIDHCDSVNDIVNNNFKFKN